MRPFLERLPDVILNLAPTGVVPTKSQTEHVPIWPDEIVVDVLKCANVGITAVHLHARDADQSSTWRKDVYAELIAGVRAERPDLVICVSCSGRSVSEFERRADVLDLGGNLRPDLASLTLGSLNFARQASINSPDMVRSLAERMNERGIKPELEIFDLGMANYARFLIDRGVLEPPFSVNIFVGNVGSAQANLLELGVLLNALPERSVWSFAGIGEAQLTANAIAIAMGGGVRVGLEDNIWLDRSRTQLATNVALVEGIHRLAEMHDRSVLAPHRFRALLELPDR